MGLMDWFEAKANQKLRKSQIKIIYQNTHAISWLLAQYEDYAKMGHTNSNEMIELLELFRGYTDDCIVRLSWQTFLPESESPNLLQVNNSLKFLYAGYYEGMKVFRTQFGKPIGDLIAFADRFSPSCGWKRFSDREWDDVVHETIARLPKQT